MPNNEITTQGKLNTLAKAQNAFVDTLLGDLSLRNVKFTDYQKLCGYNAIQAINLALRKLTDKEKKPLGLSLDMPNLADKVDIESIKTAVQIAIVFQLNAFAIPSEIFIDVRNVFYDGAWKKYVSASPQGAGNIKILKKYGDGVKTVGQFWVVRDGDEFTYAKYKGFEIEPPTWSPKTYTGKVLRVVVPILYNDSRVDFLIAERESVATNLKAQIKNALQKSDKLETVMTYIKDLKLEEMLEDAKLANVINPSYKDFISREEMIITKLSNNAIKRVPKNFDNALITETYERTFDSDGLYDNKKLVGKPQEILEQHDIDNEMSQIEQKPTANEPKATKDGEVVENIVKPETAPQKQSLSFDEYKKKKLEESKPTNEPKKGIMEDDTDELPF